MQRFPIIRRFRGAGFTLAAALLVAAASVAAADQKYPIRLQLHPGEKWSFDSTTSMTEKGQVLANGQVAQPIDQSFEQRRKGTIQITAIEDGMPSAMRITYDRESANTAAAGQQQAPPFALAGKAVNVSRKDGDVKTDLGADVDQPTLQELGHMLDVDTSFYPKAPVAINEEWDGDTAAMAKAYQLQANDKVTVKCKLLDVREVAGRQVADITVTGTMLKHDQGFIESNIKLTGTTRIDLQSGLAVDLAMDGKINMQGAQQQPGPDGTPVKISVTAAGDIKIQQAIEPLDAGNAAAGGAGPDGVNSVPVPAENPTAVGPFSGNFKGDQVALQLSDAGGQITGTLTVGAKKYPLTASSDGNKLSGRFESEGTKFDFTASLQGSTLTLASEGNTYTLKKPAANPLARPEPKNPLAQPEPKNPLSQ